jgi:DNA-binding NarL/FixJ family response regulator
VVLLDDQRLGPTGLAVCRQFKALPPGPGVVLYTDEASDPSLALLARVAGADGVVDKAAEPAALFEALRLVGRGETALPPLSHSQLEAAAQLVDPDDLALLAMLADRTPPSEVAETLHLDGRRVGRRIDRLLTRLRRPLRPHTA